MNGAMGQAWDYGSGLGLWGRPGAVGQAWVYGAGMELWGGIVAMGQAGGYGAGLGLWVRAGAVGQDCGSALSVQPPDPHMWSAVGQRCGARPPDPHMWGAVGQAWGYGAELGLWGRTVGQSCLSALQPHTCGALWVRAVRSASRPTHVGHCWAGLGLWGRPGAARVASRCGALWVSVVRAASRPTHVGRCGSELCIRPPDPQL